MASKRRRKLKDKRAATQNAIQTAEQRIYEWREEFRVRGRTDKPDDRFYATTPLLDLKGLGLYEFPVRLQELDCLETLDLSGNYLHSLPSWLGVLARLSALNLSFNRFRNLPPAIGALRQLRILWLNNNQLEAIPPEIRDLPLQELKIDGNAQLRLPDSILQDIRRLNEVLRYYFESRGNKGSPLLELKLLLVGRGGAGKTTLVRRLAGEQPRGDGSETHSISIRELAFDCPRGKVRARAWDFGGQEILHATHQFFLTERSLYLIVLEPRTGLAQRDAEYWLKLIEAQGRGYPVVVVLNWSHGRRWRVDEVKLRRNFPFVVDFVQTDAFHGDGLHTLRNVILKTVERKMQEVWLPFPERWREIKDRVARMRSNFMSFGQYTQLCEQLGENDPEAQTDLASILHTLGLALYFGNHPWLHDTQVLNPSWVTGGVYAVIRAPSVASNDGQLAVSDMPRVLREAEQQNVIKVSDYPHESHRFILELMRAFQLCYASGEEKTRPLNTDSEKKARYLVPELLPEFEPEMSEAWGIAPVRLRYRYEVLPPGLLPRFIVRTHLLSDGSPHWRHGVVLRHSDAKALIRAEADQQALHIFVLGSNDDTRRVLTAIVRRELEALHVETKMQPIEELELTGSGEKWINVKALREVEEAGRPTQRLPIQPEGTAEVNVARELDKLTPAEARAIDRNPAIAPIPVRVFVSYAHDDERQLRRLDAILGVLEQQHGLTSWRDRRLIAGVEWDDEIRSRLEDMDIFLFIARQTSLVRPYIKDPELRRAKERRAAGDVEVVFVKLEPCASDDDPFLGTLQRLAPKFRSIAEAPLKSAAWDQVRKDLLPVIGRVRERKAKVGRQ